MFAFASSNLKALCLIIVFGIIATFSAQSGHAETKHNEQHAGENKAINLLYQKGCILPNLHREKSFSLVESGDYYVLHGNSIVISCKKWKSEPKPNPDSITWKYPATRLNGDTMTKAEIAAFEIYECSGAAKLVSVTEKPGIESLPSGVYCLRALDTNGIKSPLSAGMSL